MMLHKNRSARSTYAAILFFVDKYVMLLFSKLIFIVTKLTAVNCRNINAGQLSNTWH